MKPHFFTLTIILLTVFLFTACSNPKPIARQGYENARYLPAKDLMELHGRVELHILDPGMEATCFGTLPSLNSNFLPDDFSGTGYEYIDQQSLGDSSLQMDILMLSQERGVEDTIFYEQVRIDIRKFDFDVGEYWLPVKMIDRTEIASGIC